MAQNQIEITDNQTGKTYPMHIKRARFLWRAYPARFQPVNLSDLLTPDPAPPAQKEDEQMPAMPSASSKLEDGIYNFKIAEVKTIGPRTVNGQNFGPQEEMKLIVCDDDFEETEEITRGWVSHGSRKTIEALIEANLCETEEDGNGEVVSWEIKTGVFFVGHVLDGKIKSYKSRAKKKK